MSGRRLLVLLAILAVIGLPAAGLQAVCAGKSCEVPVEPARVPFCALPGSLQEPIVNGYREGRSPDVLGVARDAPVFSEVGGVPGPWPALESSIDARVPIVFSGAGVAPGVGMPHGLTLDRVAPTVADVLAFDRPFPDVRSGSVVDGVATGTRPRLVLLVVWKGIGTSELERRPERWPFLASLLDDGSGTLDGRTGSLPLDPAATIATIGSGGLPSQHGVTGSFVRNDEGDVVPAFGDGAPVPVIATLADDLDEATGQRSVVSLVASDDLDRGLIGVGWAYEDRDTDTVVISDGEGPVASARSVLAGGAGADGVPDVVGVVLQGGVAKLDRWTRQIVLAARRATAGPARRAMAGPVMVVVAGTGSAERSRLAVPDSALVQAIERAVPGDASAVDATVPGGIFLDQDALVAARTTGQVAVDALLDVTDANGRATMADAFQGFAVSFARYC